MIAVTSNNRSIENNSTNSSKEPPNRTIITSMDHQVDAPSHHFHNDEDEEDQDEFVVTIPSLGLNNRVANITSASLPSKTTGLEERHNKLNLYDLLSPPGLNSSSKKHSMKNRLPNHPSSPRSKSKKDNHPHRYHHHHHHHEATGWTGMMRRSASHNPQGVRNASWGDYQKATATTATLTRSSFPFDHHHHHHHVSSTRNSSSSFANQHTKKNKSSSLDSAMKLQQGVDDMLKLLQSTTFVGTIDPMFHGQYLNAGGEDEEKIDQDRDNDQMVLAEDKEQQLNHCTPSSTCMNQSGGPSSMTVLVRHDVSSASLVSSVSFSTTPQQ